MAESSMCIFSSISHYSNGFVCFLHLVISSLKIQSTGFKTSVYDKGLGLKQRKNTVKETLSLLSFYFVLCLTDQNQWGRPMMGAIMCSPCFLEFQNLQ